MAETSGLGLDQQLIVNDLEAYLVSEEQCSGVAVWGNYTSGDPLVFGRNYDMGPKLAKYTIIAIYNPDDGKHTLSKHNLYRSYLCDLRYE
jgi:hypothetical protein